MYKRGGYWGDVGSNLYDYAGNAVNSAVGLGAGVLGGIGGAGSYVLSPFEDATDALGWTNPATNAFRATGDNLFSGSGHGFQSSLDVFNPDKYTTMAGTRLEKMPDGSYGRVNIADDDTAFSKWIDDTSPNSSVRDKAQTARSTAQLATGLAAAAPAMAAAPIIGGKAAPAMMALEAGGLGYGAYDEYGDRRDESKAEESLPRLRRELDVRQNGVAGLTPNEFGSLAIGEQRGVLLDDRQRFLDARPDVSVQNRDERQRDDGMIMVYDEALRNYYNNMAPLELADLPEAEQRTRLSLYPGFTPEIIDQYVANPPIVRGPEGAMYLQPGGRYSTTPPSAYGEIPDSTPEDLSGLDTPIALEPNVDPASLLPSAGGGSGLPEWLQPFIDGWGRLSPQQKAGLVASLVGTLSGPLLGANGQGTLGTAATAAGLGGLGYVATQTPFLDGQGGYKPRVGSAANYVGDLYR